MSLGLHRLAANRVALGSIVVLGLLVAFCVLVPILSPYDAYTIDWSKQSGDPSWSHPFGTDFFGRDLVVRLALGGRASLFIALVALGLVLLIGGVYGLIAGLAGGKLDELMMRGVDGLLAIPRFVILVAILAVVGSRGSIVTLIVGLAVVNWMMTARLVRGEVMRLKGTEFVRAARSLGAQSWHVALRHIAPNTAGILIVAVFLELPGLVLTEALVSALGLGINPPRPTWGNIAGQGVEERQLFYVVLVSVALAVFAISANFIADAIQEVLDPRRARLSAGGLGGVLGRRPAS